MKRCRACRRTFPAGELLTKQVRWRNSGPAGTVVKSKNIGQYCILCIENDEQYNILTAPEVRAYIQERTNGKG